MNYILRSMRAEYLKTHRTPVYWILLLCPFILNVLVFLLVNHESTKFEGNKLMAGDVNPLVGFVQPELFAVHQYVYYHFYSNDNQHN